MLIFKNFFVLLFLGVSLSVPITLQAQQKNKVTLDLKEVTLNEVIAELKKQTDYDFFTTANWQNRKEKFP